MAYGTRARVKSDWLNITDTSADTQIDNLLGQADVEIDLILNKVATVPLTGDNVTTTVTRLAEKLTAGFWLQAEARNPDDLAKGKALEDAARNSLKEYAETLAYDNFIVESAVYETSPLDTG